MVLTEQQQEERDRLREEQFDRLRKISYMANGASKFLRTIGRDLSGGADVEEILSKQERGDIQLMSFQDMESMFKDDDDSANKNKNLSKDSQHGQEYICWSCDKSLYGHRFVNKEGHPYCVPCFHDKFGNDCFKCNKLIEADTKDVSFEKQHWHEKCFTCKECKKPLDVEGFSFKDKQLFCEDCHDVNYADKCTRCEKPFKPSQQKLKWNGGQWHPDCFQCGGCGKAIGRSPFHPHKDTPYCIDCWTENFAIKCTNTKCGKAITSGGVTYKKQPYHRQCLGCSECGKELAGQRFTLSEDTSLPLCAECFTSKHAKNCYECDTPITGISGGKYLAFEGFYWHRECFYCKSCGEKLEGINFLAEGTGKDTEILCQPCGHKRRGWDFSVDA
ncbi:four and a half LIM domains protein 2-like isoform X2 [Symsagittifera roscoffensis]|uniref:four and a half LIM domains protein 2-like isoform X2 n=1 Tax=Symsagittifera roscoffensis TaxID=84072 RepID=UPI00307B6DAB